jgi:hypothetical protein
LFAETGHSEFRFARYDLPQLIPFFFQFWFLAESILLTAGNPQATSDDLSELEPRLPIPNRTVKRFSADDSADYPCESRTSSGTHTKKKPGSRNRAFFCHFLIVADDAPANQLVRYIADQTAILIACVRGNQRVG